MKAAVIYEKGAPEVFRFEEVPDPEPGPDDVLIQVEAIGIQGADTLSRQDEEPAAVPHIVGYQCAGTVVSVGEQVAGIKAGDRVVTTGQDGSHAEMRAAGQALCWVIPDGVSTVDAACVPIEFATASDGLFEFGRLAAGETVLVHAGGGGVGLAAIQLARRAGARVVSTASSDARLERLTEYGLDDGINYTSVDFVEAVRALTGGRGADVILDTVGGPTTQSSLHCLAYRGRLISVGTAGRAGTQPLDISPMAGNNQVFTSYGLGPELFLTPRPRAVVAQTLEDVASGELRVVIDRTYPLADARAAHAYLESRQALGRVVLTTG